MYLNKINYHYVLECWVRPHKRRRCEALLAPAGVAGDHAEMEEVTKAIVAVDVVGAPRDSPSSDVPLPRLEGPPVAIDPVGDRQRGNAAGAAAAAQSDAQTARPAAAVRPAEAAHSMRAHSDIAMDVTSGGPTAIPEVGIEKPEVMARGLKAPTEASQEEIARHELTHGIAIPWCEVCVRCRANDLAHSTVIGRKDELLRVLKFDYAEAGGKDDIANFDFVVGNGMSAGNI